MLKSSKGFLFVRHYYPPERGNGFVFYLLLFFIFLSPLAFGQTDLEKIKFDRIGTAQGLSSSNVTRILEDCRGYLWVGTINGICRFDGYEFKVYKEGEGGLVNNSIKNIYEDNSNKLWVSTRGGGLHYYDLKTDKFIRIEEFTSDSEIKEIKEDTKNNLYVGVTLNKKAFIAKLENGKWTYYNHPSIKPPITSIEYDGGDGFWIGTGNSGLFKWNLKTNEAQSYLNNPKNPQSLMGNRISKVIKDKRGWVWIGSDMGLTKIDVADNTFTNYTSQTQPGLLVNVIKDIAIDNNFIWLATENGGLARLNIYTNKINSYVFNKNDPASLSDNSVWSLYRDKQSRLWIGTFSKGLCLIDKLHYKFSQLDVSLENDIVNAILIDHRDRLWIGTEGGLVVKDNQKTRNYNYNKNKKGSISNDPILSISEDSKKRIWVGTWATGINRYDDKSDKFISYLPNENSPKHLANGNIYSINEERNTRELLVSSYRGLHILKNENYGYFEHYVDTTNEVNNYLRNIYIDNNGVIWIGTIDELLQFDPINKRLIRLAVTDPDNFSMIKGGVNCMLTDKQGRFWVGTNKGLHLYIGNQHKAVFKDKQGLPCNIINSILEDNSGNIWLGTVQGISKFNYATNKVENFDAEDGLISNEFKPNSCFRSKDGTLFFGGSGVNVFNPDSIRYNPHVPKVYITDYKIIYDTLLKNDSGNALKQRVNSSEELVIDPESNFFTIYYVGINLSASDKNQYAYKLEGFHQEWVHVGGQRSATFTNLDPGTYIFHVKASNNDGVWNKHGAYLKIRILPPYWKTWWFRTLSLLLIISLCYIYYRLRLNHIRRRNKELKKLVDERAKDLYTANEEINTQNEELSQANIALVETGEEVTRQRDQLAEQYEKLLEAQQIIENQNKEILQHNISLDEEVKKRTKELIEYNQQLEQFAFIAAHNLRAPVARILGLGQLLQLPGIDAEERETIFEKTIFTAEELDRVVKDINTILQIRKDNNLIKSKINLKERLESIKNTLQEEIQNAQAIIATDFAEVEILNTTGPYFDSIIYNLIHNAIKYADKSRRPTITIRSKVAEGGTYILVSDNGLGIDLELNKKNLFNLYKRFHFHVEGKGMGLYLVKTQVEALGGKIEVESEVNQGTTFTIFFKND